MKIIIHRGTKEIGGSCVELKTNKNRILIDFGMPLVDTMGNDFKIEPQDMRQPNKLVTKGVLPDISGLYNEQEPLVIDGLLISHAHFDHYGLASFIRRDVCFYMGAATLEIIEINNLINNKPCNIKNAKPFSSGQSFIIGDFTITPYLNDHSSFDSYSFLVEAEGKKVFYTGDFRKHGRRAKTFYWLKHHAPKNVDYMLLEGTNLGQNYKITVSEQTIEKKMVTLFNSSGNINLVYTSGQNIDRLVSIYKACKRAKKTLVIDFYIALVLKRLSKYAKVPFPDSRYKDIKVFYPYYLSKRFNKEDKVNILYQFKNYKITKEEIGKKATEIVMIVRPSMKKDLDRIENIDGGTLVYSLWDGYLEKESTKSFVDYLVNERGFQTVKLHTSGHADLSTLKEMVEIIKPKSIVPIHTIRAKNYQQHFQIPIMELVDGQSYNL